jgi:MscS family membrane protein
MTTRHPGRLLVWSSALLLLVLILCPCPAPGADEAGTAAPAEEVTPPPEYESPRATLNTFLQGMKKVSEDPGNAANWEVVYGAMDLPDSLAGGRKEVAWRLLGVFNHLGLIEPDKMADDKAHVEKDKELNKTGRFEFFPTNQWRPARKLIGKALADLEGKDPPSSIVILRGDDGAWRFSAQTLAGVNQLYSWIEPRGLQYGKDLSDLSTSERLRRFMPDGLKGRFLLEVELWQWAMLLALLFLVVVVDQLSRVVLRTLVRRFVQALIASPEPDTVRFAVRPMGLAIAAFLFRWLLGLLGLTGTVFSVLTVAATVVLVVGSVWAAWAVTGVLTDAWMERARKTATRLDEMLVPLVDKTLKLFIVLVGLVWIADSLDILKYFAPLIAGFGVAGLAISFAAQDMVKNLFGGLAVFLDQPFQLGERIVVKGVDGTVEKIGFRVTRIRTLTGHLITMPNSHITSEPIENVAKRMTLRRIMNLTITYDTPREKIEQAVHIVRDIFEEDGIREPIHPTVSGDYLPPRVFFNELNADSLNIFCIYWYAPTDWWAYNEHAQRVNLRIFEEFEAAGIEFAFPTQTLYLAGDSKRELALRLLASNGGKGHPL